MCLTDGAKNGPMSTPTRLSCAMRCFAGDGPEDVALVHGISHSEAFNGTWLTVDAVNRCPHFSLGHPDDHNKQKETAEGFKKKV